VAPRRSRRISGPCRVIGKPQNPDIGRKPREGQRAPALPANLPTSGALRGSKVPVAIDPLPDSALATHPDLTSVVRANIRGLSHRDADFGHKSFALRSRRGLPPTSVAIPFRYPTTTAVTVPSHSSSTAPLSGQPRHTAIHPVSLPPIVSPSRTLRRKHHMTFPRQKSTRSLRSWTSAVSPAPSVPVASVARLGHPSRPYYTAIRPHPNDGRISPRPDSPTTPVSAPPTFADLGQLPPSPPPGRPSFEFRRPRRSTTSGWSLSGEIELQIELSQRREGGEEGTDRGSGKRGSIVRGVRKLGMGLRDLVLRRA
jgi:hypothetical protein